MTDQDDARTVERVAAISPDGGDRIRDFFARHGGPAAGSETQAARSGATDMRVHAADGYVLHCRWSRVGELSDMSFSEIPPGGAES